jgi:hypothetical protein
MLYFAPCAVLYIVVAFSAYSLSADHCAHHTLCIRVQAAAAVEVKEPV